MIAGLNWAKYNLDKLGEEDVEFLYEKYYIQKFFEEINEIIRKSLSLREVFIKDSPSETLLKYCEEAYLTYIFGFYNSSVILIRAILEQALKEKYNVDIGTLGELNKDLFVKGLISREIYENNRKIYIKANKAVHNLTHRGEISERENRYLIEIAQRNLKLLFT